MTIGVGGITLASTAAAQTISTAVTLGGPQNWTNNSSNTLTVSGAVGGSGSANLTLNGTGTVILSSASGNTYAGSTTISSGVLQLGSALAVQNSTLAVNVNNGLTFGSVVGGTFTVGGLAGSGNVALTDLVANPVTLQVGNNGTSNTYAGNLSGNGGLTVLGGTQVLSGGNTYNGTTTVSGSGTLTLADGSLAAASASFTNVSVGSSGTFNVNAGVTLGSLSAPVTLTDNGATTFSNGTQSLATLNGTSGTASLALQNSTALTVSGGGALRRRDHRRRQWRGQPDCHGQHPDPQRREHLQRDHHDQQWHAVVERTDRGPRQLDHGDPVGHQFVGRFGDPANGDRRSAVRRRDRQSATG